MSRRKLVGSVALVLFYGMYASAVKASCETDADCDDDLFCNGAETCVDSECAEGAAPCEVYQSCDEEAQSCVDPDPCLGWLGSPATNVVFATAWLACPNAWIFEDVELRDGAGRQLISYSFELAGRETPTGASPMGTPYTVETALWTVSTEVVPLAIIPGTECTVSGFEVAPDGTPPDVVFCAPPAMPVLPDNSEVPTLYTVDFFIGYRTTEPGVGYIATNEELIGG
ncbi:MAG: hypothetical protein KJ749_01300, partial [Planctomycetes bacterium]|nr:hypothetical protein [Planctomycetota bacterium]